MPNEHPTAAPKVTAVPSCMEVGLILLLLFLSPLPVGWALASMIGPRPPSMEGVDPATAWAALGLGLAGLCVLVVMWRRYPGKPTRWNPYPFWTALESWLCGVVMVGIGVAVRMATGSAALGWATGVGTFIAFSAISIGVRLLSGARP